MPIRRKFRIHPATFRPYAHKIWYILVPRTQYGVIFVQLVKKHGLYQTDQIHFLPLSDIVPNPAQPRKHFNADDLRELASSITRYGVLQPLTVRRHKHTYELVAGERRLRAARLAGLGKVPCIVLNVDTEESSLIALVENLQRRDLDYIEEAEGLSQLIQTFDMSQEEAARRIGKSQSAVANKLRILKLPREMLTRLKQKGLSERHARALLRLGSNRERYEVLEHIIAHELTVARTEEYIDAYLTNLAQADLPEAAKAAPPKPLFVIKDIRLFLNTINRGIAMLKQSGIDAHVEQTGTEHEAVITIKIPKPTTV